jgi:phosphatidylinositol glycan class V
MRARIPDLSISIYASLDEVQLTQMRQLNVILLLSLLFMVYKSLQVSILAFVPCQFDTSSQLLLALYGNERALFIEATPLNAGKTVANTLEKLVVWDNVYFSDLFVNEIRYEHQFVFCPLWWRLVHLVGATPPNFYASLLVGVTLANLAHYLAAVVLYFLTLSTFRHLRYLDKTKLHVLAYRSSQLFIISPAGVFLTASYSEALCALLSFLALALREWSLKRDNFDRPNSKLSIASPVPYFVSGSLVAIAYHVRANAVLLGVLYLYDLYVIFFQDHSHLEAAYCLLTGSQLMVSIIASLAYPYKVFCNPDVNRGEWCQSRIPSIFLYAQAHYWDVGFLRYWTANNIPNFAFALPTITLSVLAIRYFTVKFPFQNLLPILIVNFVLLIGGVFWWHVQILTRISSFVPLMYWYVASVDVLGGADIRYDWIVKYFIVWGLLQTGMFGAFLPPA